MEISIAETPEQIADCYPVMRQLRPHLELEPFVQQVKRQSANDGFLLCFLRDESQVRAVAGFRVAECLSSGKYLYVDDLVTDEHVRSRSYGKALFDWLVARARAQECVHFSLDSGVQRTGAHKFYLNRGMVISSYHFAMPL